MFLILCRIYNLHAWFEKLKKFINGVSSKNNHPLKNCSLRFFQVQVLKNSFLFKYPLFYFTIKMKARLIYVFGLQSFGGALFSIYARNPFACMTLRTSDYVVTNYVINASMILD